MIGGVESLAVPAGGEADVGHDALSAGLLGHLGGLAGAGREGLEAGEGHLAVARRLGLGAVHGVTDNHAEAGLEGGGLVVLIGGRVVDGHTAATGTVKVNVGPLRDPDQGAVAGTEVKDGRPVVGEILREGAGCAGGLLANVVSVGVHGHVEHVATDDLVDVRRLHSTWEDEAVMTC